MVRKGQWSEVGGQWSGVGRAWSHRAIEMTDVSKAMELLELAEKWLEPFGVTDPFSKFRLEGYLSLKPDYRYGALALLKVGGQEVPQLILATPKLHYPFDRNGAFHFPSVKQIDMGKLSTEFPRTLMKKVFTLISRYGDV